MSTDPPTNSQDYGSGTERIAPGPRLRSGIGVQLAVLISLPATVWYVFYLMYASEPWWLFVASSVAPLLFVPVGVVLLCGVALRDRRLLFVGLLPAVISIGLFGGGFVPVAVRSWWSGVSSGDAVGATVAEGPRSLRLMTFNLNADNVDVAGVMASIAAADADVVALQEVGETMGRLLSERTRTTYPYSAFTSESGWGGLAVLSRFPFVLQPAKFERITRDNPMVILLYAPFGDVSLVNLHNASLPRAVEDWPVEIPTAIAEREAVSRSIATFAQSSSRPLLVMGDFNTTERSVAYEILTGALRDSWREAGYGLGSTFPGGALSPTPYGLRLPWWLLRIDYVFHDENFVAERAWIGEWDGGSDHRPVVVDLRRVAPVAAAHR